MADVVDLTFKVVDGLTWPWRMAITTVVQAYFSVIGSVFSLVSWVVTFPFELVVSAFRETETRRRMALLQKEFDRMAASVMELDGKVEAQKQGWWRTTEKLQKVLQQRNLLKSQVANMTKEVQELRAMNAQLEEEVRLAREARATAEEDVARASRVLGVYEQEVEAMKSEGFSSQRTSSEVPNTRNYQEIQNRLEAARHELQGDIDEGDEQVHYAGELADKGEAAQHLHGGESSITYPRDITNMAPLGVPEDSFSASIKAGLHYMTWACVALAGFLTLMIYFRGWGTANYSKPLLLFGTLLLTIVMPGFVVSSVNTSPAKSIVILCLSWVLLSFLFTLTMTPATPAAAIFAESSVSA